MGSHSKSIERFVDAQDQVYEEVLRELKNGHKVTHWMWYVFPQLAGLGSSSTAMFYAIQSAEEAQAYLQHPVLGARLGECTKVVLAVEGKSALDIFGHTDAMKFKSSMTLFASVDGSDPAYQRALDKYFTGEADKKTLDILAHS